MKAVVIGGGISGLTAAWELKKNGVDVSLFEKTGRVGSSLLTSPLGELPIVEEGADSLVARVPGGLQLCQELGIGEELVPVVLSRAMIRTSKGLEPMFQPNIMGVPLPPAFKAIAASDPEIVKDLEADMQRTELDPPGPDETVGSFVRRRLGDRLYERQVAPIIDAISASDADLLSLHIATPLLAAVGMQSPSIVNGLMEMMMKGGPPGSAGGPPGGGSGGGPPPAFYAPIGGLGRIAERLSEELADSIKLNSEITELEALTNGGGDVSDRPAVILALPAYASAGLVEGVAPEAGKLLAEIEYASVVLVQLVYAESDMPEKFSGETGILVSQFTDQESINTTAMSFATQKWGHYPNESKEGEKLQVVRVSLGKYGQDEIVSMTDSEIMEIVQKEMAEEFEMGATPRDFRVSRWPKAFPQCYAGYMQKIAQIESELSGHNIYMSGAVMGGIGIPACITSGKAAAAKVLETHS